MTAPRTYRLPRPRVEAVPAKSRGTSRPGAAAFRALVCATAATGPAVAALAGSPTLVLSLFTVQANLLVAAVLAWSAARALAGGPPLSPRLSGAVLLLAAITALMYHLVLVNSGTGLTPTAAPGALHTPGWTTTANLLLHTVTPAAVALDWLLLTAPKTLRATQIPLWLLPPLAHLGFILTRGALLSPASADRYPYLFIDVGTYGYTGALAQALALGLLFACLGALITAVDHVRPNPARRPQHRRNRISPPAAGGLK
ncbi:Pr6Pr family membrane protein [Streptomyces sp. NPDC088729]|uniref:Pr6Pr family membrane protein n=1 Tax=Streptomyces sp. NPDC088729 TaxID=3365876 RepID=UPI003814347B